MKSGGVDVLSTISQSIAYLPISQNLSNKDKKIKNGKKHKEQRNE
jgi:hypothetical protein